MISVYEKGITGKGVRVAVLDDGLEYDHDDLKQNYVSKYFIVYKSRMLICKLFEESRYQLGL